MSPVQDVRPYPFTPFTILPYVLVQYAYLSPSNLSNAFPFFADVTDVRSFDVAALNYFSDPYQFRTTKFTNQLGCSNASTATIRYQRTVLCSMWVNEQWSAACLSQYNGTSAATSQKMVCQQTCLQYSGSEAELVNDTAICPGGDQTGGRRQAQLLKDYTDCTDWFTLATNDTATCVLGDNNENNCGYGASTGQLCNFCAGDSPDDCCYSGKSTFNAQHSGISAKVGGLICRINRYICLWIYAPGQTVEYQQYQSFR